MMAEEKKPSAAEELKARYEPKPVRQIEATRQLHAARFSPCGNYLVGGGFDGLVYRWEISAEEPLEFAPLAGHGGWVEGLVFGPDDGRVYSADSWGQIRAWEYASEETEPLWTIDAAHDGWIHDLAVSADGKLLASCGIDKMVRIWSTADGSLLHELAGHTWSVHRVRFHPGGAALVSGDLSGTIKQWNTADGSHVRDLDATTLYTQHRLQDVGGVRCLVFDAAGKTLACGGTTPKNGGNVQGTPTVLLFDFATGKQTQSVQFGATSDVYVCDLHLHGDDFLMAVTSGNPGTGKLVFHRPGDEEPFFIHTRIPNCHSLSLHPDGHRLAIASTNNGSNGNGRVLNKDGTYRGNFSPIHLLEMPRPEEKAAEAKTA